MLNVLRHGASIHTVLSEGQVPTSNGGTKYPHSDDDLCWVVIKIEVNHHYALKDAAKAHRDLAARKTTGSIVLVP